MNKVEADPVGMEMYKQILGEASSDALPGLRELTINELFAHVWRRPGLALRDRRLMTIALLAAQGRSEQLRKHLRGARLAGFSKKEMLEVMVHVAHYAGWAAGTSGQETAISLYEEDEDEDDRELASLMELNEEMGRRERAGDGRYFGALLESDFVFRRANGAVEDKAGYLRSLEMVAGDPYEQLDTYVRNVAIDKDTAVVNVLVAAKRRSMVRVGQFQNVRVFRRAASEWKLFAWVNTRDA